MPMRHVLRLLILAALLLTGCAAPHVLPVPHSAPPTPLPLSGVTVVLDPGHGGEDPGAVCPYATEATYTYRAALEIGQYLTGQGATVLYTVRSRALDLAFCARQPNLPLPTDARLVADGQPIRERHSPRQLWLRAAPARRAWNARTGPDAAQRYFFLSLHLDESPDTRVRGSMVCIDRRRPAPAFALALASELVRDGLARPGVADGPPGLSRRELGVLNPAYNPVPQSALLELATLSHLDDLFAAADPAWRERMAWRIEQAILTVRQGDTSRRRH